MKTVSYEDDKLRIKFYTRNREEFEFLLLLVKSLFGRMFDPIAKVWTAPITDDNIKKLEEAGFIFMKEAVLLKNEPYTKVKIEINTCIKIYANISVVENIKEKFTCDDYSYAFAGGKFDSKKIIKRKFIKIKDDHAEMSIGFIQPLFSYLDESKIEYEVEDKRKFHNFTFTEERIKNSLSYLDLYDYQIEAVKACIEKKNGIIKLPTGAGKTEIFLSLCKLMNVKVLILFSRIDLARQTYSRAEKAGLDTGIVQGNDINEDHQIVMCTIQSSKKLKNTYDMVIVDECHNSKGKQYKTLLKQNFLYRFGFSATPFADGYKNKLGNYYIMQYIGDIIYTLPANYLIDQQKIARPKIRFLSIEGCIEGDSWFELEDKGIIDNGIRNDVIVDLCNRKKRVVILIKKIKHGVLLEQLIDNSLFLYGNSDVCTKQNTIERFEKVGDKVIIASTIFDEGINIKSIRNLIIAGGGKSQRKVIQRLGRGLRITENKSTVNIYDFYDKTNQVLERHSEDRLKFYKKEGFEDIIVL